MEWYLAVLKKYAVFEGRARRQEYWMFVLFSVLISLALFIVGRIIGTNLLSNLYALAVFLPSIGVGIRRLHDTNRSGWLLVLSLIPCVGAIILIVFLAQEGQAAENQYGPNPKEAAL